jgi:SAM-dependent methyltransferase
VTTPEFPNVPGAFRRIDESPDSVFYAVPRKVVHIDDGAIAAVTRLYADLLEPGAEVLDLMSSWRSHLPEGLADRVVGLGMNQEEMEDNPQVDEAVIHDLNEDPRLPFLDRSFDAVLCCVSVQYLVRPLEVFADVSRVLRPGGPLVVTFSNRCFPEKAVGAWLYAGDTDHLHMVRNYFQRTHGFLPPVVEDRSPGGGDPLFAVWARATPA